MTHNKNLEQFLIESGADSHAVQVLSPALLERILRFSVARRELASESALVAFAFGNRREPNGNVTPGPINQALARVVEHVAAKISGALFAQWEIAESLADPETLERVQAIYPVNDIVRGSVQYLSTIGVLRQVLGKLRSPDAPVAIIAHHDHVWRCLHLASLVGMRGAYVPSLELPKEFDAQSAQGWTQNRERYLLHELHCRLELERSRANGSELPG